MLKKTRILNDVFQNNFHKNLHFLPELPWLSDKYRNFSLIFSEFREKMTCFQNFEVLEKHLAQNAKIEREFVMPYR